LVHKQKPQSLREKAHRQWLNKKPTLTEGARTEQEELFAGVHFFILADIFVFAALFTGFMVERAADMAVFDASTAQLDAWVGVLNTLILVTSGLCIAIGVDAARKGQRDVARRWIAASFLVGIGFGISKVLEYGGKISAGITMHTNDFFMFYYALTGAHFLHFLGGMAALAYIYIRSAREEVDGRFFITIEGVGLYWHMVDLLWIFIFPLLYLLGTL